MLALQNALVPILALWAFPALAFSFEGRVMKVKDGDSLVVQRDTLKRESEIRLAGIDAPEFRQPWGQQSRAGLRRIVQGQMVRVEVIDKDRYGRLVAKVWLGRAYVNAAMTQSATPGPLRATCQTGRFAPGRMPRERQIGDSGACRQSSACRRPPGANSTHGAIELA